MRDSKQIVEKVTEINKIRVEKSKLLVAEGKEALEPYTFDYLLLCNKICGKSHYNMQMKIVVSEPKEFNAWLKEKQTFAQVMKADQESKEVKPEEVVAPVADSTSLAQVIVK
jgi:cytochrome c oxidase subunit 2